MAVLRIVMIVRIPESGNRTLRKSGNQAFKNCQKWPTDNLAKYGEPTDNLAKDGESTAV